MLMESTLGTVKSNTFMRWHGENGSSIGWHGYRSEQEQLYRIRPTDTTLNGIILSILTVSVICLDISSCKSFLLSVFLYCRFISVPFTDYVVCWLIDAVYSVPLYQTWLSCSINLANVLFDDFMINAENLKQIKIFFDRCSYPSSKLLVYVCVNNYLCFLSQ